MKFPLRLEWEMWTVWVLWRGREWFGIPRADSPDQRKIDMDVESQQTINAALDRLHSTVVDPAITRLDTETIPALQKAASDALQPILASAITNASDLVEVLGAHIKGGVQDVSVLVASLDGWTLDITIPPITIRLSKPKGEKV